MTDLQRPAEPVVIALPAEIDMANAEDVGDQLRSALTPGVTIVTADMTSTVFCDCSGIRSLLLAHDHAAARDASCASRYRPVTCSRSVHGCCGARWP